MGFERYEEIYRKIKQGDCIYCGAKRGMIYDDACFVCTHCQNSIDKESYYKWLSGEELEFEGDNLHDPSYDDLYDEYGDVVLMNCPECNNYILWKNGQYICPICKTVIDRIDIFNFMGAEPPGPECLSCDNLYPGCVICPHGYVDETD